MAGSQYAPLPDGEDVGDSSSEDSDSGSESSSEDDEGPEPKGRSKMEFTEVFTWMTVWVMIIFAVYSSEVRAASLPRRQCRLAWSLGASPVADLTAR